MSVDERFFLSGKQLESFFPVFKTIKPLIGAHLR
jgi:hypothetical protein